jgi:hypothetical protein
MRANVRAVDAKAMHHATNLARDVDEIVSGSHNVNRGDALGLGEGPDVEFCRGLDRQSDNAGKRTLWQHSYDGPWTFRTPGTAEMALRRRSRSTEVGTPWRRMNDADLAVKRERTLASQRDGQPARACLEEERSRR